MRKCEEDSNKNPVHKHSINNGHFIRGFAGIKLSNNNASIECCDEKIDNDILFLNNIKITWKEFKNKYLPDWKFKSDSI